MKVLLIDDHPLILSAMQSVILQIDHGIDETAARKAVAFHHPCHQQAHGGIEQRRQPSQREHGFFRQRGKAINNLHLPIKINFVAVFVSKGLSQTGIFVRLIQSERR